LKPETLSPKTIRPGAPEPDQPKVTRRLSYRQARNAVLLALILGVLFNVCRIYLDLSNEHEQIKKNVSQTLRMAQEPAAQAAASLNEDLGARVVASLLAGQGIEQAKIMIDDPNLVLAQARRPAIKAPLNRLIEKIFGRDLTYSLPLFKAGENEPFGRLVVMVDGYAIALDYFRRAGVIVVGGLLLTVILAFVLYFMFYYSLTKPLLGIIKGLAAIDPAGPGRVQYPRGRRDDEVGLLVLTINQLLAGLTENLERRRTAERLALERESRIKGIMDNVPDALLTINEQGLVEDCNPAAETLFGCAAERLAGQSLGQLVGKPEGQDLVLALDRFLDSGDPQVLDEAPPEGTALSEDGLRTPVAFRFGEMHIGERRHVVCLVSDISQRKQAEAAFQALVESTVGAVGQDFFDRVVVNLSSWLGCDVAIIGEIIGGSKVKGLAMRMDGRTVYDYGYDLAGTPCENVSAQGFCHYPAGVAGLFPQDKDLDELGAEGYVGVPVRDRAGRAIGILCAISRQKLDLPERTEQIMNIIAAKAAAEIERKRAEEALRESEEKYRILVEKANDAIMVAQDGLVKFPNPKCLEISGYSAEELTSLPFVNLIHPEDRDMVMDRHRRRLAGKKVPSSYAFRIINKKGEVVWVTLEAILINWEGRPATLNFLRDTTEQRRLEAQLLQAQKMEAVGNLAGGIAHDFNNLLQAIHGYTEMLLFDKAEADEGYVELKEIERAAGRASELTRQLLTFSRKIESRLRPLNLNDVIKQMEKLLSRTLTKMINIELHLAGDLDAVNADPAQIEQILMNLALNARDAMPEGGRLVIETENVTLDEDYCETHLGANPGEYVLLSISDTGHGMDRQTLRHIFDPFYTTKETGEGTGLGLAMVYGLVKNHGGYITCYSEPGLGATFKIYLPAADRAEAAVETQSAPEKPIGGRETILLVDDEDNLRSLGRELLQRFGYTVWTAPDGETAIELFHEKSEAIDLVILDLIMPGLGGRKCLEEMLRIDPKAKIVVTSGFSPNGSTKELMEAGARSFISKPYNIKQMLTVVRRVLDGEQLQG